MDPYDRAQYRYRPPVTGKPAYSWYPKQSVPKKTKVQDFQHQLSAFSKTGLYPSDFIVSPEWISEDFNDAIPFLGRRWKPWPYEYHGARYWPHGTVENKLEEERNIKALVTPRQVPSGFRQVEGQEREIISPNIRLSLIANKAPWRPKTSCGGYVVSKDHGTVFGNSQEEASPERGGGTGSYSRHVRDMQFYKGEPGYEDYFDHNSRYHSHHPDDVGLTSTANVCNPPLKYANATTAGKSAMLFPDLPYAQRPKFERPFMNMASAMWIGSKYTTSPAQN